MEVYSFTPRPNAMLRLVSSTLFLALLSALWPNHAAAQWEIEAEASAAFPGYNTVRVPGQGGSQFSFTQDLKTDIAPAFRARLTGTFGEKHQLSILVAPLQLFAQGTIPRPITFQDATFAAGSDLAGKYKFNSYRLTYRYMFVWTTDVRFGLGLTAKLRDALIRLSEGTIVKEEHSLGIVPLVHARFDWLPFGSAIVVLEADALAAKKGRAEDVLLALEFLLHAKLGFRIGYRILEGGVNSTEVYNFTAIRYAVAGIHVVI